MNSQSSRIVYAGSLAPPSSYAVGTALDRLAYGSLCVLIFALPWENTSRIIPWLGLVTVGMTFLRTAVLAQARRLCELHYLMLAFAAWSCASIVWTLDLDSTAARVGTYSQLLLLAWVIWILAANEARVIGLLQCYVLGTYVTAIGTISNAIAGRSFGQLDDMEGPTGNRYIMSGMNPNAAGSLLAPSIPMTLYLLARRNGSPATTLFCWLQLVLCVTTIFLSASRGGLLAAAPALVMFPLIVVRLRWWQRVLGVMAIAGTVVCGAFLVPSETWQRISGLREEVAAGTMTHRTEIWKASLEVFRDHAFVGVGADGHGAAVTKFLNRPLAAHNTFLSVLVELGVVGELLLLGLLGAACYCALQMPVLERALWILTLVVWCIGASSATMDYLKVTWFLLGLLAAHAYVRRDTARVVLV
jgi:O-antigen ligase